MKKMIALMLVMLLMIPMASVASASTMTMTFTVPEAEYTLVIPQDLEVPYKATSIEIDGVSVTDAFGFAEGKDLKVTVTLNPFSSETTDTVMPFTLSGVQDSSDRDGFAFETGDWLVFEGQADGSLGYPVFWGDGDLKYKLDRWFVNFKAEDWTALKPGNYTGSIIFSAEIVESISG